MTGRGDGLAATKLRAPALPERLVRRTRLDDVLDAAADGAARLVLVSAPAGSGKSTLLASWLAGRPRVAAWLQVEAGDSDPARFWSYLVQAVAGAVPGLAGNLTTVVAGSAGDELVAVPALVNALAELAQPLVVVVDDYHLVDDPGVHRGVERLVDLCPPQVTLVVATRMDPPFRLGRLRVRRQLAEVRDADLRFAAGEASVLLGSAGELLDGDGVAQLCARTEGWAAGLVLAGLSLGRARTPAAFLEAFAGDDALVVEYLRDEFLSGLPAADRLRLLQTSVLDQLDGALVDAVTGSTDGAAWLHATAATNQLLIGLDTTGTWFRYHHLLRDLLRLEAAATLAADLPTLHARAAEAFEERGSLGRAVEHRLAAGQAPAAAQLMRRHGPQLLRDGQVETLRARLEELGDLTASLPACALLYGWCEYLSGRYDSALRWLDRALEVAPDGFDVVMTTSLRINVALARGQVATALADARAVDVPDVLAAHPCDLSTAVGVAHTWAGRADDARRVLRLTADRAVTDDFPTAQAIALAHLAVVELEHGTMQSARDAADLALATAARLGLAEYPRVAPAYAVRALTGDDATGAVADARRAVTLARRSATRLGLAYVLAVAADTLLEHGDPTGRALLAEARTVVDDCADPGSAGRRLARTESRHGVRPPAQRAPALVEQLTDRELDVLRYLPTGLSQRDIAAQLFVSLNTVKSHCQATYRKLGVVDRKAAVQAARDLHLL